MLRWSEGGPKELDLEKVGERYGRYRLHVPEAERAMARSLERYGQISPAVVCQRDGGYELIDGFKRLAAARALAGMRRLTVRLIEVDERGAKAAIYGLNRAGGRTRELEEAWIVHALVREDGLTQVEVAELLGRHKSWVCRRLALIERLGPEAKDELRVGLLCPTAARQMVRLPEGNQAEVLAVMRREALSTAELAGVVDLLWQCPGRSQQGKIERPFFFVETNLLNARTFSSRDQLNEVTAWWLANVSDTHVHRETKQRPIDRYQEERPYLLPLPERHYDTSEVVYRTVNTEGYVSYRGNLYSVPWQRIGEFLPLRITENELIIYGTEIDKIARHELFAPAITGQKRTNKKHLLGPDLRHKYELLRQRFEELGPEAVSFFDELVRVKRCGKDEARRILGLLATYRREDLAAALERARRYRAYSLSAVERILGAQAEPRTTVEALQEEAREHLGEILRESPVPPRSGSEYQDLLENVSEPEGTEDEEATEPDESA